MGTWLSEMYQEKIYLHPDPGAPVMYRGKNRNYCNLVRYDAYHIGCAETECDGKKLTFCLTNKPPLQINETVYYAGDGACPKGACRPTAIGVCNEDTGLCLTPLPTTTPKPTTKRPKSNDCYFSFFMAGCMM
ncbi:hypothetical protein ANCCAN_00660 [Ancylostoma caninum]|uniref:SCP domain-containing protein n=1 Tax=Ancylostoma caninum TaxID=29170 RepID=A0A368HBU8_ANCCA|nr:hypothetical protein ANCCAN_00660 [Ancylostoma caninum]